jgi:hypothetical protein
MRALFMRRTIISLEPGHFLAAALLLVSSSVDGITGDILLPRVTRPHQTLLASARRAMMSILGNETDGCDRRNRGTGER